MCARAREETSLPINKNGVLCLYCVREIFWRGSRSGGYSLPLFLRHGLLSIFTDILFFFYLSVYSCATTCLCISEQKGSKMKTVLEAFIIMLVVVSAAQATEFVTIGNPGNAADTTGYGAVGYIYQISKYEVTGAEFQSAVSSDSRIGTFSGSMSRPVADVTWYEAAKYCNWLTTGDAYLGAYQFNGGGTLTGVNRATAISAYGTVYVLPTENEWYKAAYFKGGVYSLYANGTGTAPGAGTDENYNGAIGSTRAVGTGTAEQNGTYDMNGNVWEWNESARDGTLDNMTEYRMLRGGCYLNNESFLSNPYRSQLTNPGIESGAIGFRVAAIPEPASVMMIALGGLVITGYRKIRKSYGF